MKSAIYEFSIEHHRLSPKRHSFKNKHYMFLFDLDELDELDRNLKLFSHHGRALFNFRNSDYSYAGDDSARSKLNRFFTERKCNVPVEKVLLLTSPRHLGYVFNPLSVYYCFDKNEKLSLVVPEICNTFHERKSYLICQNDDAQTSFKACFAKEFYISPFTNLDDILHFEFSEPGELLNVQVTTKRNDQTILIASMSGRRRELTDSALLDCMRKYPFSNFFVSAGIHAHALLLWLKGVPHFRKELNPHLQTNILRRMSK
ncbi:DUF1365 domain-containing protein [bacterium]|nr:DUF1365 domain-containing protein [bacterium]